jgi:hypothetical protein
MSHDSLKHADDGGSTTVAEGPGVQAAKARPCHFLMAVVDFCLDAIFLAILML